MLPHMDAGRPPWTRGMALGHRAPTSPVTSALKNSSFSNMLQVPGRYAAASRVSEPAHSFQEESALVIH